MTILYANNAFGELAASITTSATTLTLQFGQGARFPTPTNGDFFYMTLIDTSNQLEIVKCTDRQDDSFTIVREQEDTVARAYTTGDRVELRLTAAGLSDFAQRPTVIHTPGSGFPNELDATLTPFDKTQTNRLTAENVQDAIDTMVGFFTATVVGSNGSSNWTRATSADPWIATLTVNGIRATDRPIVDLDLSGVSFTNVPKVLDEWPLVYRVEASADDELKLYATAQPPETFPLTIKVVR